MKGFLLSAGYGKRMEAFTSETPKPLLPVAGYPLICYVLFLFYLVEIEMVVVNLHYLGEKIFKCLQKFPFFPIHFIWEERLLGSAGGIRNAIPRFFNGSDTIMVCNSDTITLPLDTESSLGDFRKTLAAGEASRRGREGGAGREAAASYAHLYLSPCMAAQATQYTLFDWQNASVSVGLAESVGSRDSGRSKIVRHSQGALYFIGTSLLDLRSFTRIAGSSRGASIQGQASRQGGASSQMQEVKELNAIWAWAEAQQLLTGSVFSGISLDCGTREQYVCYKDGDVIPKKLQSEWEKFIAWYVPPC